MMLAATLLRWCSDSGVLRSDCNCRAFVAVQYCLRLCCSWSLTGLEQLHMRQKLQDEAVHKGCICMRVQLPQDVHLLADGCLRRRSLQHRELVLIRPLAPRVAEATHINLSWQQRTPFH